MKRPTYYDYISDKLNALSYQITRDGKQNLLGIHVHSESFYCGFFNLLYSWNLENLNESNQNAEAVDLEDKSLKIIFQVSATCTKQKIQESLDKLTKDKYDGYRFCFVSIAKDAADLRTKIFTCPDFITFDPAKDIYDITSILSKIKGLDIQSQQEVFHFIQQELGSEILPARYESNIATIINILAKEDIGKPSSKIKVNSFEIDKKIDFNKLSRSKRIISQYVIQHPRVDSIYQEFDKQGANKSLSVLALMEDIYMIERENNSSPDIVFRNIVKEIVEKIQDSANYEDIPIDELYLCVKILVIDSFIRCKIFDDPTNYNYATT